MPRRAASTENTRSGPIRLGKGPLPPQRPRRSGGDEGVPVQRPGHPDRWRARGRRPGHVLRRRERSGKSTLLEGIAAAARLPTVGSDDVDADTTLAAQRELADALKLVWRRRTKRGFFLRAEDFFGFTKRLADDARRAAGAARGDRGGIRRPVGVGEGAGDGTRPRVARRDGARYGVDLDANSHGQSFLQLFRSRFVPGGLYLLDEPEAPLSPQSQLGADGDDRGHGGRGRAVHHRDALADSAGVSGGEDRAFDEVPVRAVRVRGAGAGRLARDFLAAPERYLRRNRNDN